MSLNERWGDPKKHILELDESQMMVLRAMLELAEVEYSKLDTIHQIKENVEISESDFDRLHITISNSQPK